MTVTITDVDRKQQANFLATASGLTVSGSLGVSPLPAGATVTRVFQGAAQGFTTRQGVALSSFNGSLNMGQNPGAGVSAASVGGNFVMIFEALPGRTFPSPVEVGGGPIPERNLESPTDEHFTALSDPD